MAPTATHTLVFPAGMPESLAFLQRARSSGQSVVGASSRQDDPARTAYDEWDSLPFVTDTGFDAALANLVRRRAIGAIYAPHFVVARHLARRLPAIAPGTKLLTGRTPADEDRDYRALQQRCDALPGLALPDGRRLAPLQRAGLFRLVGAIPGMCGEEKMAALIDAAGCAPAGDIVEIGSWWGRSAALLVCLARHFAIGPVLCIDPWSPQTMRQGNPLLDPISAELDTEQAFRTFQINLSPLALGQLNYLRSGSDEAVPHYRAGLEVTSDAFGTTRYGGRIAMLHIDGNHAADQVERDVDAWARHVVPGGWIIFDDYEWAFGDGPRTAADRFVHDQAGRIRAVFRAGPALLVQLNGGTHG